MSGKLLAAQRLHVSRTLGVCRRAEGLNGHHRLHGIGAVETLLFLLRECHIAHADVDGAPAHIGAPRARAAGGNGDPYSGILPLKDLGRLIHQGL